MFFVLSDEVFIKQLEVIVYLLGIRARSGAGMPNISPDHCSTAGLSLNLRYVPLLDLQDVLQPTVPGFYGFRGCFSPASYLRW